MWNIDATKILTGDEITRVICDLKRKSRRSLNTRQNLAVFRLACCCGLRASEIAGLKINDVVLGDTPYLKVLGKGNKKRKVPLWWDRGTLEDITAWREERMTSMGAQGADPLICTLVEGKPHAAIGRLKIRLRFKAACGVLGKERVGRLTVHHGRHSFISHALDRGKSVTEVQKTAGHSSLGTTSIYAHVVKELEQTGDLFG